MKFPQNPRFQKILIYIYILIMYVFKKMPTFNVFMEEYFKEKLIS